MTFFITVCARGSTRSRNDVVGLTFSRSFTAPTLSGPAGAEEFLRSLKERFSNPEPSVTVGTRRPVSSTSGYWKGVRARELSQSYKPTEKSNVYVSTMLQSECRQRHVELLRREARPHLFGSFLF
jgi:hypothetical protein